MKQAIKQSARELARWCRNTESQYSTGSTLESKWLMLRVRNSILAAAEAPTVAAATEAMTEAAAASAVGAAAGGGATASTATEAAAGCYGAGQEEGARSPRGGITPVFSQTG